MSYTTSTDVQIDELPPASNALSFFISLVNAEIASVIFDMSALVYERDPPPELTVAEAYPEDATSCLAFFNSAISFSMSDMR